ncbi:hypothetical protein Nepgr_007251 [Nepenthes gracilis]|uniref:Katanin p80 WD40 repeat-containing subunit B1 homolog n=1 Tax=Nepenthes gracilis TaxID=150966 RepID=A0AAD3S6T9_NEPGR|nr:hypothetical protein Nepgr_007251 [Nepenthes gracilis]
MAKRGYKLQEFAAHSAAVNCLSIGKKACRLLLTGGDDHKVNLWAIGKPASLMSLCGHISPVECVAFDSSEVLVLAGASSGAIKLWDLQEAKMVRTLTGHRSNCTAVEFHPFGEFFASGSADTDLKIWDIRKKGCFHTYKGHGLGINTIKFTPDGRWVVSGGFDNVVKVWDLTAGKLLHDFKFHEGHIRSIAFHPLEFLLATGSADRTVKFWDLETFEMIGSARAEATGVRATIFHPDGRTLFCGYDDNVKVYSWEPIICHDAVDMGWSTLCDLCIHEGKLIGCSYFRNSIGVWVAELSLIEPYGAGSVPEDNCPMELKLDPRESHSTEKVVPAVSSTPSSRSISPDFDIKEIKNIYVDYGKPINSQKVRSFNSPKVLLSSDSKESSKLPAKRQSQTVANPVKPNVQANVKSFAVPSIVPRESPDGRDLASVRRESLNPVRDDTVVSIKPSYLWRSSSSKLHSERQSMTETRSLSSAVDPNFPDRLVTDGGVRELFEDKYPTVKTVEEKSERNLSPHIPSVLDTADDSLDCKEKRTVKVANGVAVVHGRTRSLVEKFERRENSIGYEDQTVATAPEMIAERIKRSTIQKEEPQISGRESTSTGDVKVIEDLMQNHDVLLSGLRSRLTKLQVVRHFWERNDFKGAINAMKKLPDPSVQVDVISVLVEKMEIINLDLFSSLLPVFGSLLDSKLERHAKLSLEMLVKLVAVFGSTICSIISAPPAVGVDLHQEQRVECCKQCFSELQKIHKFLPHLARRGGLLSKSAQELNLVLLHHNIQ